MYHILSTLLLLLLPTTSMADNPLPSPDNEWPDMVWPDIRLYRYHTCTQNEFDEHNFVALDYLAVNHCKNIPYKSRRCGHILQATAAATAADEEAIAHCRASEATTRADAFYWQLPPMTTQDRFYPVQRCNITLFERHDCIGPRIVKFTNEAQDVCIATHHVHSIKADCYTRRELDTYTQTLGTPTPSTAWMRTAMERFDDDGRAPRLAEPVVGNGTYPEGSERYWRSRAGRERTWRFLDQGRWGRCGRRSWWSNRCDEDAVNWGSPRVEDYSWMEEEGG